MKKKLGLVLDFFDIVNIDPETWSVTHTSDNTGYGYSFFLSVKLHRQLIKLLIKSILKIASSKSQMATRRSGMG